MLRLTLDRVLERIPSDEDVGIVGEQGLETLLDEHDPLELERVVSHRLAIMLGIIEPDRGEQAARLRHGNREPPIERSPTAVNYRTVGTDSNRDRDVKT